MSGKAQEAIRRGAFGQEPPCKDELAFATERAGGSIAAGEGEEAFLPGEKRRMNSKAGREKPGCPPTRLSQPCERRMP